MSEPISSFCIFTASIIFFSKKSVLDVNFCSWISDFLPLFISIEYNNTYTLKMLGIYENNLMVFRNCNERFFHLFSLFVISVSIKWIILLVVTLNVSNFRSLSLPSIFKETYYYFQNGKMCGFLLNIPSLNDLIVGIILLIISLFVLSVCLILIVKVLSDLLKGKTLSITDTMNRSSSCENNVVYYHESYPKFVFDELLQSRSYCPLL